MDDNLEIYVNRVVDDHLPPAVTRDVLREATAQDDTLRKVMQDLERGQCRKGLTGYEQVFAEICEVDGMLMRGEQLIIPKELQAVVVQIAHEAHFGYDKTLNILRQDTWFPGIELPSLLHISDEISLKSLNVAKTQK